MEDFLVTLGEHIKKVEDLGKRIEDEQAYLEELKEYIPALNEMISSIFMLAQEAEGQVEINTGFILGVLSDIVYGIENDDSVFLLDVLRYGLLRTYYYIMLELQNGECYE